MTTGNSGAARSGLPPLLRLFWAAIVALTAFSALYTFVMIHAVHAGYPYNIPWFQLRTPMLYHWDFRVFDERFQHFRTPSFWDAFDYPFTYPATLGVVFGLFYALPQPVGCYLGVCGLAIAVGAWQLSREMAKRGVSPLLAGAFTLTLVATSWPLLFLLQRANIEGVVVLCTAGAMAAVLRRRWWLAATLIGLAGAMKIFPLVLLGLLLARRRFRELAWGLAVAAAANLLSLAILGPGVAEAQRHIAAGLAFFQQTWVEKTNPRELMFDHSLFAALKIPVLFLFHPDAAGPVRVEAKIYTALSAVAGIALYFLVIRRLPVLNQLLALTVCAVLLPPVSMDYTLPHLLLPFGLLCLYATEEWKAGRRPALGLRLCFALFAFIFTDLQYLNFAGLRWSGQFRCLALTLLLITVLRFRMPWSGLDDDVGALPPGRGALPPGRGALPPGSGALPPGLGALPAGSGAAAGSSTPGLG